MGRASDSTNEAHFLLHHTITCPFLKWRHYSNFAQRAGRLKSAATALNIFVLTCGSVGEAVKGPGLHLVQLFNDSEMLIMM